MKISKRARREARRLYRACMVGGLMDEDRARLVARRIAAAHLRGSLPILSHFMRLVRIDRAAHLAVVESAVPLAPELVAQVEAGILSVYGAGTSTAIVHNPGLIGGMKVQVGSDVYDGTVRGALTALEERF